ncbi:MAG: hypothetical protein AAF721_30110 [Myxococcota bacterium]
MMSLEAALRVARRDIATSTPLPAFAPIEAAVRWRSRDDGGRPSVRARWLATVAAVLALVTMTTDAMIGVQLGVPLLGTLAMPVILLALSAVLIHRGTLGGQLLSRATWWAFLLLGVGWSFGPAESLPAGGALLALSSGVALLAAGRVGLRRQETLAVFDPVAFRGNVLVAMLIALGNVMLLAQFGLLYAEASTPGGHPFAMLTCAAVQAVGVWGLSRLRAWAVFANLGANVAVLVLLLAILGRQPALVWIVAASAAVQLVLPVRMLVAFRRGAAPSDRGTELGARLATALIVLLMLVAVPAALLGTHAAVLP